MTKQEQNQSWYHKNKDKECQRKKDLYRANPEFYREKSREYRLKNYEAVREREKADPKRRGPVAKNKSLKYLYGLTLQEFKALRWEQSNKCYICKVEFSDKQRAGDTCCVDHCHTTKRVRGLLCSNCNSGLGRFKDNIDYLQSAAAYLKLQE